MWHVPCKYCANRRKAALEIESEDEDFEENEDNYESTTEEIAVADAKNYDSNSGESIEYLSQELRERATIDRSILYKSKHVSAYTYAITKNYAA